MYGRLWECLKPIPHLLPQSDAFLRFTPSEHLSTRGRNLMAVSHSEDLQEGRVRTPHAFSGKPVSRTGQAFVNG
jgi:hypothetical protein